MSHRKLLVREASSKVGLNHPTKMSRFFPVFPSAPARRGTMLVSEDVGRKTLHLVSSAFLAAVYLELLTEPATLVIGLAKWPPSLPSGDCEEGNLSGRGRCGMEWPQEGPLLVRELWSGAWDIIPFRVI